MDNKTAIQVIDQALNAANLKGVFNLQDSYNIVMALATIKGFIELEITPKLEKSK